MSQPIRIYPGTTSLPSIPNSVIIPSSYPATQEVVLAAQFEKLAISPQCQSTTPKQP